MLPETSDNEAFSVNPVDSPFALPPHFNFHSGSQDPRLAVQMNSNAPVGSASKRPGAPVDTPPKKEQRASQGPDETSLDISLAEFGIPSWNDEHIRLDVQRADLEHAINFPTMGWSSFESLYGAPPGQHVTHEIFDPTTPYERKWGVGLVSIALRDAGAPLVNSSEFRMLNGHRGRSTPLADSSSLLYILPGRRIRVRANIQYQRGAFPGQMLVGNIRTACLDHKTGPRLSENPRCEKH